MQVSTYNICKMLPINSVYTPLKLNLEILISNLSDPIIYMLIQDSIKNYSKLSTRLIKRFLLAFKNFYDRKVSYLNLVTYAWQLDLVGLF